MSLSTESEKILIAREWKKKIADLFNKFHEIAKVEMGMNSQVMH